MKKNKSLKT